MNNFTLGIIILLVVLGGGIGYVALQNKANKVTVDDTQVFLINAEDHVLGDRDADVVLYEYSDMECPACAAYHPIVKQVTEHYGDQITFVHRHFPLYFHPNGKNASQAIEAAGKQDKFFEMVDALFTHQGDWASQSANIALFDTYAETLGLNMDQYRADRDSKKTKDRVQKDTLLGNAAGVDSTPTFFLNEIKINGLQSAEQFIELIDAELATVETEIAEEVATTTTE